MKIESSHKYKLNAPIHFCLMTYDLNLSCDYYDVGEFKRNTVSNTKLFELHLYWNLCVAYFVLSITICVFFLKRKIWFCSIKAIDIFIIINIRYKSRTQYTKLFILNKLYCSYFTCRTFYNAQLHASAVHL